MRLANPIEYLSNPVGSPLPPQVVKAFVALGRAQRGEPEDAMSRAQNAMGGGNMYVAIEHVGDITHRMTNMLLFSTPDAGYSYVKDKIEKTFYYLKHPYVFQRDFHTNMESNARHHGVPLGKYMLKVNEALLAYAAAHAKLPVYNRAQWIARESAVALGYRDFHRAAQLLDVLQGLVVSRSTWWNAATEYTLDASGQPMLYQART